MSDQTIQFDFLLRTLDHLTPAEKLELIEQVARSLRAEATGANPGERRATLERLRRELAAMPVQNPADAFSNRDHDGVLYGGQR